MRKTLAIVLSALMLMTACCFALPVSAAEGTPINNAEEFAAMTADGKPTKVGYKVVDGVKKRVARKTGEVIDN